ncbi:MAG TPA: hypothetical protein V6D47_00840 [Oscillatoriaceae cyanobacterium]
MSTLHAAVTGTDGTGKTTIVRRLAARYAATPGELYAFRAPQYHEDPNLPFGRLSRAIDDLSVLGDRLGNPLLKTAALFLSMTLYGDVARFVEEAYRPRVLLAERQCLADSLTYARFYLPYLKAPLDRASLESPIAQAIGPAFDEIEAWLPVFQARADVGSCSFWELPLYLRSLFEAPVERLVPRLQALYHAAIPEHVVLLSVSPEALVERLASKQGAAEAPKELHESAQVLSMFQAGLKESCEALRAFEPRLRVTVIDTSKQTPEMTEAEVLAALAAEKAVK